MDDRFYHADIKIACVTCQPMLALKGDDFKTVTRRDQAFSDSEIPAGGPSAEPVVNTAK